MYFQSARRCMCASTYVFVCVCIRTCLVKECTSCIVYSQNRVNKMESSVREGVSLLKNQVQRYFVSKNSAARRDTNIDDCLFREVCPNWLRINSLSVIDIISAIYTIYRILKGLIFHLKQKLQRILIVKSISIFFLLICTKIWLSIQEWKTFYTVIKTIQATFLHYAIQLN